MEPRPARPAGLRRQGGNSERPKTGWSWNLWPRLTIRPDPGEISFQIADFVRQFRGALVGASAPPNQNEQMEFEMAARQLPPIRTLRQLLEYDASSGRLRWKVRTPQMFGGERIYRDSKCKLWNDRYAGEFADSTTGSSGYRIVSIFDQRFKAHRIVWKVATGEEPANQIDHINGNREDNRICNLRLVSNVENARNKRRLASNKTGQTGVHRNNKPGKDWVVDIKNDGRTIHLGTYATFKEAVIARKAAEKALGFHQNHGR